MNEEVEEKRSVKEKKDKEDEMEEKGTDRKQTTKEEGD